MSEFDLGLLYFHHRLLGFLVCPTLWHVNAYWHLAVLFLFTDTESVRDNAGNDNLEAFPLQKLLIFPFFLFFFFMILGEGGEVRTK